jgi:hypothetical protein
MLCILQRQANGRVTRYINASARTKSVRVDQMEAKGNHGQPADRKKLVQKGNCRATGIHKIRCRPQAALTGR